MRTNKLTVILIMAIMSLGVFSGASWAGWTQGSNILYTTTDYVGIGTSSPTTALQIGSKLWLLNNTYGEPVIPGQTSTGERILFYNSASYKTGIGMLSTNGIFMQAHGSASMPLLQIWGGSSASTPTAKFTFLNNGNFGIGTSSPTTSLQIGDRLWLMDNTHGDPTIPGQTSPGERILFYNISPNYKTGIGMLATNGIFMQAHGASTMPILQIWGGLTGSAPTPKVSFLNNGNVGIGITDPDVKLAVNGTIKAREVRVTTIDWSDFVFDKGYKLPSLEKVESYINENNHLPDVPSAQEVRKDGINVSDMMARQMQKIEELTLYMIELKKENEALKKDNQAIKERLSRIDNSQLTE